jgi:hypothetical protein
MGNNSMGNNPMANNTMTYNTIGSGDREVAVSSAMAFSALLEEVLGFP